MQNIDERDSAAMDKVLQLNQL